LGEEKIQREWGVELPVPVLLSRIKDLNELKPHDEKSMQYSHGVKGAQLSEDGKVKDNNGQELGATL